METVIITTEKNLENVLYNVLTKIEKERIEKRMPVTLTINQVAKRLGKAHVTVARMIKKGIITTTPDGKIIETELDKFFI